MNPERLAHNFLMKERGGEYTPADIELLLKFRNAVLDKGPDYKVGVMMVSINPHYWPFLTNIVHDINKYFLPGHQKDILLWTDAPQWSDAEWEAKLKEVHELFSKEAKTPDEEAQKLIQLAAKHVELKLRGKQGDLRFSNIFLQETGLPLQFVVPEGAQIVQMAVQGKPADLIPKLYERIVTDANITKETEKKVTILPTDSIEFPYPTLMRYHLFLGEEEKLKEYDYLFYIDLDMRIVNYVGDEILGPSLTAAPHPGYYVRKEYIPPYEPNKDSKAYIPRLHEMVMEKGKPRLLPFYAAGGLQGGKTEDFIKAMKVMKGTIDTDLDKSNYIAIWNDESHWNKYLFDHQEKGGHITFLNPSYVYPDSLIEEYYKKVWGRNYPPKIITLTKKFSLTPGGMGDLQERLKTM